MAFTEACQPFIRHCLLRPRPGSWPSDPHTGSGGRMASQSQLSRGVSNVNNNIANRSADRLSVRGVYDHTDDATGTGT